MNTVIDVLAAIACIAIFWAACYIGFALIVMYRWGK